MHISSGRLTSTVKPQECITIQLRYTNAFTVSIVFKLRIKNEFGSFKIPLK